MSDAAAQTSQELRRVLVIEDEVEIARLVELHLRDLGCEVKRVENGVVGLAEARDGSYDLIVLDLMLPELDGLEVCRRLRSEPGYTPILMLTARSSEIDRVLGLETGADDYLTKPFSVRELVARAKAIFRRVDALRSEEAPAASMAFGDLHIDTASRTVVVGGTRAHLTAKEFDLLLHFAKNPGRVYSRTDLLDSVWGYAYEGYEHTVNSHINRLRNKIEDDPRKPRFVLTVWGVGYRFAEAGELVPN
ncbi:MAG: response regulator transcription factor [Acidobacteriota bacterium]